MILHNDYVFHTMKKQGQGHWQGHFYTVDLPLFSSNFPEDPVAKPARQFGHAVQIHLIMINFFSNHVEGKITKI